MSPNLHIASSAAMFSVAFTAAKNCVQWRRPRGLLGQAWGTAHLGAGQGQASTAGLHGELGAWKTPHRGPRRGERGHRRPGPPGRACSSSALPARAESVVREASIVSAATYREPHLCPEVFMREVIRSLGFA